MKNESKIDEMVQIMSTLHRYIPATTTTVECQVEGEEQPDQLTIDRFHQILFGGDQLTVARARSAQAARLNSSSGSGQLQGFIPVVEDWHAKLCLLQVSILA